MNTYYDEAIGFEPILPIEIIDLLHVHKSSAVDQRLYESITATGAFLDEHELAMVV
jgi:hypothetical protein